MAQENNVMTLSSLRNDRTFATICQFFHTFQSAFRPWPNYSDTQWISLLNRPRNKSDTVQDDYVFSTEVKKIYSLPFTLHLTSPPRPRASYTGLGRYVNRYKS
jgi:hypothetical protein